MPNLTKLNIFYFKKRKIMYVHHNTNIIYVRNGCYIDIMYRTKERYESGTKEALEKIFKSLPYFEPWKKITEEKLLDLEQNLFKLEERLLEVLEKQ